MNASASRAGLFGGNGLAALNGTRQRAGVVVAGADGRGPRSEGARRSSASRQALVVSGHVVAM